MSQRVDVMGQRFGRLLVIGFAGLNKKQRALWQCRCDCGNITTVGSYEIRNGKTASCGCHRREVLLKGSPRLDLSGQRFGRLVVSVFAGVRNLKSMWVCICDCGNTSVVSGTQLRTKTESCGCLQREAASRIRKSHGLSSSPEYLCYINARQRCTNPANTNWKDYGGRGIEFRFKDFVHFHNALGFQPFRGATVDRIDNAGHYEPGNVRWATRQQQTDNRRPVNPTEASARAIKGWETRRAAL